MENKLQNRRRPIDPSASSVTLLQVDQNVSKVFAMAQTRPIMVCRYHTPFAVILSTSMWIGASKLENFVPPGSPLIRLSDAVDLALGMDEERVSRWPVQAQLQIPADKALRSLLIMALHSIPTEAQLHSQILSNMAFRWFVGVQLNERLWDCAVFARSLRQLLECEAAVEVLLEVLQHAIAENSHAGHFTPNVALARSWALRHPGLQERVPLQEHRSSPLILMPVR